MKHALRVLAFFTCSLGPVLAAGDVDAPVRIHHGGTLIIMHSRVKFVNLVDGNNTIGPPENFTCKSAAGCVVAMSTAIQWNDPGAQDITCFYVDGVAAAPGCYASQNFTHGDKTAQAKVSQGDHIITLVVDAVDTGSQILGWTVQSTIYERKVRGAD